MPATLQFIYNMFIALRFQENYKAVLCSYAGYYYKLSTICSFLVFRKITKQCSAPMPATLQFIYNLFSALRFQEYYKAAELRNICRNEVMA